MSLLGGITLKVGKKYRRVDGVVVKICEYDDKYEYPYICEHLHFYDKYGNWRGPNNPELSEHIVEPYFEPGDRVKVIQRGCFTPSHLGKVGTIVVPTRGDIICVRFDDGGIQSCSACNTSPILDFSDEEETMTSKRLEKLVDTYKTVNEELKKHIDKLQMSAFEDSGFIKCTTNPFSWYIRVTPKKTFALSEIGGWKVSIEDDTLQIGCISENTTEALSLLKSFLHHNLAASGMYSATRNGIAYEEDDMLSWEDAEELYEALKDYLEN